MRLLSTDHSGEFIITEFSSENLPDYAILSHTWDDDEVVFADIQSRDYKSKHGYRKIQFCAEQAQKVGLKYFWVDTCCINKGDSAELSESINSMFRWYHNAARCYVYLSDVSSNKRTSDGVCRAWEASFRSSRWFTRGWTLQELLASVSVEFFSREGQLLGNKAGLVSLIQEITGIPHGALTNEPLSRFAMAERMRWAADRTTTKPEDKAYCLLGIFDVFIPPIYGEGDSNALDRLKGAINGKHGVSLDGLRPASDVGHRVIQARTTATPYVPTKDRVDELRNLLGFEQMDSRRATIKQAYPKTCAWLLKTQSYMDWIDYEKVGQHGGFLWIKGKPGAGKSTIVKFAHVYACKSPRNGEIIISYFFNARGNQLEKSTLGMYRSLLSQLLQKAEDIQQVFEDIDIRAPQFEWDMEQLRELMTSAVQRLGSRRLKCFIDALDECDEDEIRDMIGHFEVMGRVSHDHFTVCFASRHYPTISIPNSIQLILEDQPGHSDDLTKYIQNRLQIGEETGKILGRVRADLQEKANGVFMWVVLVIDILNKEFERGRVRAVQKRLSEIPAELSDLFKQILRRDTRDMHDLLLCIQWILFAKRPLDLKEWYFAVWTGRRSLEAFDGQDTEYDYTPAEWDPDESEDVMKRFLLDCSKGLAELTKSGKSKRGHKEVTVQFIHESVRDFLIKDRGLYELWPELEADAAALSHRQLSKCCQRYLTVDLTAYLHSARKAPKPSSAEGAEHRNLLNSRFPFLSYASKYVFCHASEATTEDAEDDFLAKLDLQTWILASNMTAEHNNQLYTDQAPLIYVLAEHGFANFVRKYLQSGALVPRTPKERYAHPALAAIANQHWGAVQAFLEQYTNDSRLEEVMVALKTRKDVSVARENSLLHWALSKKFTSLAEILLDSPQLDVSAEIKQAKRPLRNPDKRLVSHGSAIVSLGASIGSETVIRRLMLHFKEDDYILALCSAAGAGQDKIVTLLLDSGVDVNNKLFLRKPPLQHAIYGGHQSTAQLLLDRGAIADIYVLYAASTEGNLQMAMMLLKAGAKPNTDGYFSPLKAAAANGHLDVIKLLLDAGAEINPGKHTSPLQVAAKHGHLDVIKLLLDAGASIEHIGNHHHTALQAAAAAGHQIVTMYLIEAGANVNSQDHSALQAAAYRGMVRTARMLLDAGADVNAQGSIYGNALRAAVLGTDSKNPDFKATIKLLLEAGADVNAEGKGRSALEAAIVGDIEYYRADKEVVQLLLDAGADVNIQNGLWHSAPGGPFRNALHAASSKGHHDIVKLLLEAGAQDLGDWNHP